VAGVDAYAVAHVFREPGLGLTVAQDAQHIQIDDDSIAVAVLVTRREIPIDAAANLRALDAHGDALRDIQYAVRLNRHVDVIAQDALVREHAGRYEHHPQREQHGLHEAASTRTAGRSSSRAW